MRFIDNKEKLIKIAKKLHQEAFDANAYYLIINGLAISL